MRWLDASRFVRRNDYVRVSAGVGALVEASAEDDAYGGADAGGVVADAEAQAAVDAEGVRDRV